jgi:hypothetical protein
VGQRPGDLAQAELVDQVLPAPHAGAPRAVDPGGEEDVLLAGELRDEVEELKDEADRSRPQRGELAVARAVDALAGQLDRAAVGAVQPGDEVQERRLAGPGAPDDRHELARVDVEVRPVEHASRRPGLPEGLREAPCAHHRHRTALA